MSLSFNAFWLLGEAAAAVRVDSTGHGNDLTNGGGTNVGQGAGVCGGHSASFNAGVDDHLDKTSTSDLSPSGVFEITGWFQPITNPTVNGCVLIKRNPSGIFGSSDYALYHSGASGKLTWKVGTVSLVSSVSFLTGWHFFDVYFDGVNLGVSVDLASFDTVAGSAAPTTGGSFGLGHASNDGGQNAMGGLLSNVGLIQSIHTTAERNFLAGGGAGGCPPSYPFSGNIAWELYLERVQSGSDLSAQGYGNPTYFIFNNPVANVEYSQEKNVFDTDGLASGDPAYLKVRRLGSDANNTDTRTQTLVSVDLSIPVKAS